MELILAIDDDKSMLNLLSVQLQKIGYRVIKASSGAEGLEMAQTGNPNLILLDIGMPVMDGFAVLSRLKGDEVLKDIPVIILTAKSNKEDLQKAMRFGVLDYILKPYDINIFSKKIKSALHYSKMLKSEKELERSQHIDTSRSAGKTVISFLSRLREKYLLDDARRILSSHFLKVTQKDIIILDLRSLPDLNTEELPIIKVIIDLFPRRDIYIVAGKYYGIIISEADLEERVQLFISFGDLELHLEKEGKV